MINCSIEEEEEHERVPTLNKNLVELIMQRSVKKYEQMEPNKKVILRWATLSEFENEPLESAIKFEYELVQHIKSSLYGETYLIRKKEEMTNLILKVIDKSKFQKKERTQIMK